MLVCGCGLGGLVSSPLVAVTMDEIFVSVCSRPAILAAQLYFTATGASYHYTLTIRQLFTIQSYEMIH